MRIRTQFIITMLLFGIVLVAISTSAILTNRQVDQVHIQGEIASNIAQGASELSYLSNDYVMYRESQQYERWQTRYAAFSKDVAGLQAEEPEQQALIRNIQANTQRLKEVFDSVVISLEGTSPSQSGTIDPVLMQVSWSRMAVQSQGLVSDAARLSRLLGDQANQLQLENLFVVFAMIVVFGAFYFVNYLLIQRRMLKSIANLQAGTAKIGSGNLDFRIETKRNDEIGDLSHAFNTMASDLKAVTASKTDLQREIEERKMAEEALRKSEEKYRTLFSTMDEGFGLHEIILDAEGNPCDYRFLELNDAFERMTGLSSQQSIGKTVKEILPGVEPYWIEKYGKVALTGEPARFDNYSAPLGKWYETFAYAPVRGQFAVLFSDITERKEAEQKLVEQAAILASVHDAVIGYNTDYQITYWNRAAEEIYGYSAEEAMGKASNILLKPTYEEGIKREDLVNRLTRDEHIEIESGRIGRDGKLLFVETHVILLKDKNSKITGYVAVDRDITERKRTSERLATSETRYRRLFESAKDGILILDADTGHVIDANPFLLQLLGYAADELLGKQLWEIGMFENIVSSRESYLELQNKGYIRYENLPLETKYGKRIEVEFVSNVYQVDHHKVVQCNIRDITERKKAERDLRETRDYLDNLINYANAPIIVWNPDFEITRFNHAFERLTGRTAAEVMGKKLDILFPDASRDESMNYIRQAAGGERWEVVEIPILHRGGAVNIVLWNSATLYAQDGKTAVATIAQGQDITERKEVERDLRETRDYLDNLINYANAPIIVWNPDFEITRFNHAFERLTGRTAEEVIGKKLDILFPDDSRDESMNYIRKAAGGERWEVVEIPILHRDGTVNIVLWNSATLYAQDGKTAVATIAQGQDITERKEAEEELRKRTSELEALNQELESFSYSVSHDLRAPLRSMEGFSSALIEDYADKLDDQGKQYLKYVQESSNLMAQLIDDLLKLSRVTRTDMNYGKVDISAMTQEIADTLGKAEPDRKVKLKIEPGITTYGDAGLLRHVLSNLLGNAWKFSSKAASPVIEVGITERDGKRACFVRDNGVGFDMTYADKLFKPFQRLHKTTEFAGTGIGLATVKRVILRHGGEVWAESKPGEGATFYFTISKK